MIKANGCRNVGRKLGFLIFVNWELGFLIWEFQLGFMILGF